MRQVLEVGGCASGEAHDILSDLRRIYYRSLVPIIERTCSASSAPGRLHRVDLLEIDLGELPLDGLEAAVARAFEPAFARALADAVATSESDALDSDVALITHFIHTGMVPWWADRSDRRLLEACLEALIARAPRALREAIASAGDGDGSGWRRIARAFPDRLIDALVVLMPACSTIAPGVPAQWVPVIAEAARACGQPASAARGVWWEELLRASSVAAPAAGAAHLFPGVLIRVARRFGVEYFVFVEQLRAAVGRIDDERAAGTALSPQVRDVVEIVWLDACRPGIVASGGGLATAARGTAAATPDTLPGSRAVTDSLTRNAAGELEAKPPRADAAPSPASAGRERRAQAALRFGDADEVYVDNAGLVVLWPFLESFFAQLGLLEARRFNDPAARQRAVGLLQYLAAGDAAAPEFLVPLNKVLCGMPLDDVFEFGAEMAADEIGVCGDLLTAAIQHAPILRDMSIAGFRRTFLLREGQLSARDGCWLLRVHRETHDIVLDRFPWSVRVVKLPWMETMMVVEW